MSVDTEMQHASDGGGETRALRAGRSTVPRRLLVTSADRLRLGVQLPLFGHHEAMVRESQPNRKHSPMGQPSAVSLERPKVVSGKSRSAPGLPKST